MGCCLSHENRASEKQSLELTTQETLPCVSKSPPRPEEESVKEVLSETPKPKPGFQIHTNLPSETEKVEEGKETEAEPTTELKVFPTRPEINPGSPPDPTPPAPACSTPEEISDSVSLSESISNTTLGERDEEVHQCKTGYRSQWQNGNNKMHNNNRAVAAGRSPSKRAVNPSTGQRRNPVQRMVDPGENSGRRSRSPGKRANVGRSPSGRRNGPSPGRVRMGHDPNESARKVEESESEWQGPNESLENPLVSLECFIFL